MKRVFITGAGSGLGKEACIALARRGHTVYASVHYESQIAPLVRIAEKENLQIDVFKLDILDDEERSKILKYDIDILINNAAIGDSGSIADVSIDRIEKVFNTNVFANLHVIQLFIQKLIKEKQNGRIVILSSLVGRIPMPFLSPYCASKFALEAFGDCLNSEMKILKKLSHNIDISVSLIEPGAYATGFNMINIQKKYSWMHKHSYFSKYCNKIQKYELKIWNFIEQKSFNSIIKKYIKCVEAKRVRLRYSAPAWQSFLVQLGRILGM